MIQDHAIKARVGRTGGNILPVHAFTETIISLYGHGNESNHLTSCEEQQEFTQGSLRALLKVQAVRAFESAVSDAQHIMGGLGFTKGDAGEQVEQISRDFRVLVTGGGSEDILTDVALRQETACLENLQRVEVSQ